MIPTNLLRVKKNEYILGRKNMGRKNNVKISMGGPVKKEEKEAG